jgi:type I restriction enzyme S subunit
MSKYKRYERYKDSGVEWIGEIPEHWEINKLKRLSNIITGNTPPKSEEENYDDEGIPWVKPDNIQDDGTISETKERLSVIGLQKARLIPKSSAIVCCIGTVGKVGFTQEDCTTNQQINSIIFERPSIWNNKYGFYCLCSSKNEHEKYSNKVVVSILNKTQQGNILMPVPSLKEQKAIASFLDQKTAEIDDLIADKEKLIELLQEKRQVIITEAVTKGLNPNVRMKDSGVEWIGEIPEHWEIRKLKYLGEAIIGLTYSPEEIADEGVLVLRASNIKNNKIVFDDNVYVNKKVPNKLITRHGDILICSRSGSRELIGKNACIDENSEGFTFGAFMTVFRSKYWRYLYYVFNSTLFKYQSGSFLTSTINQLTINNLNSFIVPLPPENEQKHICDILDKKVENIDTLITEIQNQIQKLKEYRQSLISEAVTGKIDVREFGNMSEVIYYEQNNSPCSEFTHAAE